jgi:hypothetical protein
LRYEGICKKVVSDMPEEEEEEEEEGNYRPTRASRNGEHEREA